MAQASAPVDNTRMEVQAAFNEMRRIADENGISDMSLDEINAEIDAVREVVKVV